MNLGKNAFTGWTFDVKSAALAIIGLPVALFFLGLIRKSIKAWGAYLIEGVMYWLGRSFKRSLAGALTLKRYCRLRLSDENRYLFVPSSMDIKLEVDSAFVTLSLDQYGRKGQNLDHRTVLKAGNRLRVIGDPGSGKSTFIKRLFRDACYQAIRAPSKARLPILIELKTLSVPTKQHADKLGDWFVKRLRDTAAKSKVYQMDECFGSYAEGSGLLVLLDGLDEVSTNDYPRVQSAIIALSQKLTNMSEQSIIVLTMRTQFHLQIKNAFRDHFGHALVLKPFTPGDIYEFLTRWPFRDKRDREIGRIYGELTDRPTLREMCSNPLVLSMYVAEDQAAGHIVAPESRTEFYAKVTEELLLKRRLQQTGPTPAHTKLREQREQILGRLAYEHILDSTQPTNSLDWTSAIQITQEVMKCSAHEAEAVFREISKETGLVSEERPNQTLRFIHLTFCEFLAAFEAIQGQTDGWNTLLERHRNFQRDASRPQLRVRLLEVIPFACGLLPRVKRPDSIKAVATTGDDGLLARCFLETKQYDHEAWPLFVDRQRATLLKTSERKVDDRWLRDLHLFSVVIRDAVQCSTHMPILDAKIDLEDFFQSLLANHKTSLSQLLSSYASQDAAAAFRLAEVSNLDLATGFPDIVIANCDQGPFLGLVVEKALEQKPGSTTWAALIAESALRSEAVGLKLWKTKASAILKQQIEVIPKRCRWIKHGWFNENLYTQLITIGVRREFPENSPLQCLNSLKSIPAPGHFFDPLPGFSGFLLLLPGVLAFHFLTTGTKTSPINNVINGTGIVVVVYSIGIAQVIIFNRIRGYRALLGLTILDPEHDRLSRMLTRIPFMGTDVLRLGIPKGVRRAFKTIEARRK